MKQQSWRPFILVSLALCIGTMGTALSSPLYPIYQQLWKLLPSDITAIFIAYMLGCLTALLFLGRSSNSLGFVRSLQIGLIFALLGLVASALAQQPFLLEFGRFMIGIASGLISTAAMLGLLYTIPERHKAFAPQLSSIITVIGFALGPLLGGSIAQFSSQPLITPYLPIIIAAIVSFFSLFSLKGIRFEKQAFSIAPHLQLPQKSQRPAFYLSSLTAFSAFASFSLFASLAPSFIQTLIPWHGPLVSGASITSILIVSAAAQISAKKININLCLHLGQLMLFISSMLLMLCMWMQWSGLFFISVLALGIGHGLSLMSAFALIHRMTEAENRAAVVATYLFIAYWGTILPIISVGYLSDHWGLSTGVISFCIVMGSLSLLLLLRSQCKLLQAT